MVILEMGCCKLFAQCGLEPRFSLFELPSNLDYRHEHQHLAIADYFGVNSIHFFI
jgi:hypothetical protein